MAKTSLKVKQARKPKYSTRAYTRCRICGRPHSVLRKYGICRICVRELAYKLICEGRCIGIAKRFGAPAKRKLCGEEEHQPKV